jgi:hypothetical protein
MRTPLLSVVMMIIRRPQVRECTTKLTGRTPSGGAGVTYNRRAGSCIMTNGLVHGDRISAKGHVRFTPESGHVRCS